ncbi:MAG: hypothetical protein IKC46_08375 [Lachnospiraceae bacterium]|nr:hypothetical protein [Lachnospiraceae bacterium]
MKVKKSINTRVVVLLLALVLMIGGVVGGSLAFLMTKSDAVVNTFVAGAIGELDLDETETAITTAGNNTYLIVPGKDIAKDPYVTYTPTTDGTDVGEVYIFVKVTGGSWMYNTTNSKFEADSLSWAVDSNWTYLSDNVIYRTASAAIAKDAGYIIADNKIEVADTIKEDDIDNTVTATTGLTFTAYAIQAEGFTGTTAAADAWNAVKDLP